MTRHCILLLAVLLFPPLLSAQPRPDLRKDLEGLELTAEQQKKIKDIVRAQRKQMIDLRASIQKKRIDLRAITDSETPDRRAFENLSKEIADIQLQQRLLLFDSRNDILKILTPEQRQQWKEIRSTGSDRLRDRIGKHRVQRDRN